jgi:hypothetical protein
MPPTKESGTDTCDECARVNVGPCPHVESRGMAELYLGLLAERDALRAFVEQVSWLDPTRGPMDIHTMVGHARRLLDDHPE